MRLARRGRRKCEEKANVEDNDFYAPILLRNLDEGDSEAKSENGNGPR